MIPHLAILTLSFMAFSASADPHWQADPNNPVFALFKGPICGINPDNTTDESQIIITQSLYLGGPEGMCSYDTDGCMDLGAERFNGIALSAGFWPRNSNFQFTCFIYKKKTADDSDCNSIPIDIITSSTDCLSMTDFNHGFRMQCSKYCV